LAFNRSFTTLGFAFPFDAFMNLTHEETKQTFFAAPVALELLRISSQDLIYQSLDFSCVAKLY